MSEPTVIFADPTCQYPDCANPTANYVNVSAAMFVACPTRMEARCASHGGALFSDFTLTTEQTAREVAASTAAATAELRAELNICGAWHCSGNRRCELPRGHDGYHDHPSLIDGIRYGDWHESAAVDVPRLLKALDEHAATVGRCHRIEVSPVQARLDRALRWAWRYRSLARQWEAMTDALAAHVDEAILQRDAARAALGRYGSHDLECEDGILGDVIRLNPVTPKCICGLSAALEVD